MLDEMEETVKIAVRDGSDDPTLDLLVEMTLASILEKRPVFASLAEEPLFYRRYIVRWVKEALDEEAALRNAQQYGLGQLGAALNGL